MEKREYTDNFLKFAVTFFDNEEKDSVKELVDKFINTPSPEYTIEFLKEMDDLLDDIEVAIDNDLDYSEEYDSNIRRVDNARDWISYYRRQLFRKKFRI